VNSRTTLILAGIFLILGAYIYFVELQKSPEQISGQAPRPAPQVFDLANLDVTRLEIRDLKRAQQINLVRVAGAWQIEQTPPVAADTNRLNDIVDGFKHLQASRVFTDVTDLTQYGVLTGTLEARMISSDSKSYALTVGNKLPAGDSYYAIYTGGKQPLFVIATTLVDEWLGWFDKPPLQPTPAPTSTASPSLTPVPLLTPSVSATPTP
jgi:hypothetical protein